MAQRKKAIVPLDLEPIEREVRELLARDGAVKLASVKPAAARGLIVEKLAAAGFEVTSSFVRRPLRHQLREALAHAALVPVKSLASHVRGGKAAELKALVDDAIEAGEAHRVLRGAVEVLAGPEVRVLSSVELRAMRARVSTLGKALEKVTRNKGSSLLASDAAEQLGEVMSALGQTGPSRAPGKAALPATPTKSGDDPLRVVLEAVDAVQDGATGLSFVPAVVGRLAPQVDTRSAIQLLLRAAERELLELRPEGGIGRLSEAELSACPAGPHGTRLSWARRLPGGAT